MRQNLVNGLDRGLRRMAATAGAVAVAMTVGLADAAALDKIKFGTNWKAQAEHGGFYQAIATGIYKEHGLEVDLRMGGPQVNHSQLLAAGAVDLVLGQSNFSAVSYVKNNVPLVVVAAFFQKDLRVLIAHPNQGNDTLEALKGKPILVAESGRVTYWAYLKAKYGYTESQVRPYTFNLAPFFVKKDTVQQGYLTAEPYTIEQKGINPVVLLLSDHGYDSYASTLETTWKMVNERPDVVQRFVDASIKGWYSYLWGDPAPGNALIKQDNPEMTDGQIAYSIAALKRFKILDCCLAAEKGIGAISDARWKSFYDEMVAAGALPAGVDLSRSYTTRFVNKGVGMDMKKK